MTLVVAVGAAGKLTTSPDGTTWTARTSSFGTTDINGIAWASALGLFVAVGAAGKLATSPDGETWTARTSGFGTTDIYAVCWSPELGLLVAGGASGVLTTSPDGTTWTARTSNFGANTIYTVSSSPTLGLLAAGSAGALITSTNGTTWTARTSGFGTSVIYGSTWANLNSTWVIAGEAGKLSNSTNGTSWSARSSTFGTDTILGVAWSTADSLFVAVGDVGKMASAGNHITWLSRTSGFGTTPIEGIVYSPGLDLWFAVGDSGMMTTCPNPGTAWTARTSGFDTDIIYGVEAAELPAPTPTATGSAPVAVASSSAASTVATATGISPITAGSSSEALSYVVGTTTGSAPVDVGSSSEALTITTVAGMAPVNAGSSSEASVVGGSVVSTTGSAPVSVRSSSSASIVGIMAIVTNPLNLSTVDLSSDSVELEYTPPFAGVDTNGLPPIDTIALPPVVTIPGFPPVLVERMLTRESVTVPAMVPETDGRVRINDAVYAAYPTVKEEIGVMHTIVGGVDVTYFRGCPVGGTEQLESPFGDVSARVTFPQITQYEETGVGVTSWLKPDATFDRIMVHPDGSIRRLWSGNLISEESGTARTTWTAVGTLWQASTFGHRVPLTMKPADRGTIIARSLNRVIGRVYPVLPVIKTGIFTQDRGSSTTSELSYVQGLLATMWTAAGRQWTVMKTPGSRKSYRLGLKPPTTTIHHTFTAGQRGVEVNLSRDMTGSVNFILGHGILPNGYAWSGRVWPNYHPDTTPGYPNTNPLNIIVVGTTDADTDSGTGVSDWQQRVNDLNLTPDIVVNGVFSSNNEATLLAIQKAAGLTEDGELGPQSWQGTFSSGDNNGDLNGSYRRPMAVHTTTEPHLYSASGAVIGANPGYTGAKRYELDLDYGPGSTPAQARVDAAQQIARDRLPGWTGTLTVQADSREDSKFFIIPNQNSTLLGYRGGSPVLPIVAVNRDYDTLKVVLTVDERSRDAMTVASIRNRDKAAKADPGRRPGFTPRRSGLDQDLAAAFDGDSEAGIVRSTAIIPGYWIPIRFPLSTVGSLAKVQLQTSPPTKFYASLFNSLDVTPAHLLANVGDPSVGTEPYARTDAKGDALDALGLIQGWGEEGAACGYGLKSETTGTLNGRFINTSPQTYNAIEEASVTLMVWAEGACHISGRLWPSPVQ